MVFLFVGTFKCSQPRHPAQIPVGQGREGGREGEREVRRSGAMYFKTGNSKTCTSPVCAIALNPKETADGREGQAVRQTLTEPVCMYRSIYPEQAPMGTWNSLAKSR